MAFPQKNLKSARSLEKVVHILLYYLDLSLKVKEIHNSSFFSSIKVGFRNYITHNVFIDEFMKFCLVDKYQWRAIHQVINKFSKAPGVIVNEGKYLIICNEGVPEEIQQISDLYQFKTIQLQ